MRRRRLLFILLSISIPIVLLVVGEGITRLCGLGGYPPVFLRLGADGGREWFSTYKPGVDSFFYAKLSPTGGMQLVHFADPTPDETVRIVLLGGSAMEGFPQVPALSNAAFLEAMLTDLWHGENRRVEVLNLGTTAVASFPVMCFLEEILDHDPDLVVIMTGNNEFYGAYGVASLHGSAKSPTGMRLVRWVRGIGLVQWLSPIFRRVPQDRGSGGALMEQLGGELIEPGDTRRPAAKRSLGAHLSVMVRACAARDTPVMLCTLPTNERGLAPIGAGAAPELAETLERAAAMVDTSPSEAIVVLEAAISEYPDDARAHYLLGEALGRLGNDEQALVEYVCARDLDTMPWRATSAINDAVRDVAAREGATLCDMEAAFRKASPHGSIGWELMDDHVHMSLAGQALFARTVVEAMTRLPGRLHVDGAALAQLPDGATYARRLGANDLEAYAAARRIRTLLDISFMRRCNPPAAAAAEARCAQLLNKMQEADRRGVRAWEDPAFGRINVRPLSGVAGYYHVLDGDYDGAVPLFALARRCLPAISPWRLEYTWYLLLCSQHLHAEPTEADRRFCREGIHEGELLERFGGMTDPLSAGYLGMIYAIVGRDADAITYLTRAVAAARGWEGAQMAIALTGAYLRTGRTADARAVLERAAKDSTMAAQVSPLLEQFDSLSGHP